MTPRALLKHKPYRLDYWAAFGFGSGLSPWMPGTCGTVLGLLCFPLLKNLTLMQYGIFFLIAFVLGCWLCDATSKALGAHDHAAIVWDEMVGIWLVLPWIPVNGWWWLAAFVSFRFFDIVKPFPISWLDRHIKGGAGIMLDDVAAAIPAWLCLFVAHHYLPIFIQHSS